MSWSINDAGTVEDVKAGVNRQYDSIKLADEGEQETVRLVRDLILQTIETFDPTKKVFVSANGHMAFDDWDKKTGRSQQVNISIR